MSGFYQTRVDPGRRYRGPVNPKRIEPAGRDGRDNGGSLGTALLLGAVAILVVATSLAVLHAWTAWDPVTDSARDSKEERDAPDDR
jgi:hypothetical protein